MVQEEVLRERLQKLRELYAEVGDLERRAQKRRRTKAATPADLDRVCAYAATLRSTAPPVQFPVRPDGFPAAPLPARFSLPFLPREEIAKGMALRAASTRASSPRVEVLPAGGIDIGGAASSGRWEARVKPDGAEVVLITRDGSLPRPGNQSARSVSAEGAVVPLLPGNQLLAAAVTPGMRRSDVIVTTVAGVTRRPKAAVHPSGSALGAGSTSGGAAQNREQLAEGKLAVDGKAGPASERYPADSGELVASLGSRETEESATSKGVPTQPVQNPLRQARGKDPAAGFRASLLLMPGTDDDSESDQSSAD